MILSNVEIHEALDSHRLIIDPQPTPRFKDPNNKVRCPYDNTAVDLCLSPNIRVPKSGPFTIDTMSADSLHDFIETHSDPKLLTDDQPYTLKPNKFILGITNEVVELPIIDGQPSLAARIEGKSSLARCGLLIHFSAPTVHAGWAGGLALEIINLGPATILLGPKMPIAQLIIEIVQGEIRDNPSDYKHQTSPSGTN